jgi:hypothetical protein
MAAADVTGRVDPSDYSVTVSLRPSFTVAVISSSSTE